MTFMIIDIMAIIYDKLLFVSSGAIKIVLIIQCNVKHHEIISFMDTSVFIPNILLLHSNKHVTKKEVLLFILIK